VSSHFWPFIQLASTCSQSVVRSHSAQCISSPFQTQGLSVGFLLWQALQGQVCLCPHLGQFTVPPFPLFLFSCLVCLFLVFSSPCRSVLLRGYRLSPCLRLLWLCSCSFVGVMHRMLGRIFVSRYTLDMIKPEYIESSPPVNLAVEFFSDETDSDNWYSEDSHFLEFSFERM
jgi:hypothetical protein